MEGDLLEVALDETEQIWRILSQTCIASKSVRKYAPLDPSISSPDGKEPNKKQPQQRGRKRKSEEFELMKKFNRQKIDDKTIVKRKGSLKDAKPNAPGGPIRRGPRKVMKLQTRNKNLSKVFLLQ